MSLAITRCPRMCENILIKWTFTAFKKNKQKKPIYIFYVFSSTFSVSQSGLAGDVCPDPGVPENGKRMGSAFQ